METSPTAGAGTRHSGPSRDRKLLYALYYHADYWSQRASEGLEDTVRLCQRVLGIGAGWTLQQLFSLFTPRRRAGILLSFFQIALALPVLCLLFVAALALVLVAGTLGGILGFRNLVYYSLKEQVASWVVLILAALLAPAFLSDYWLYKASLTLCLAIVVVGLDFLYGQCGILSFGHAGFVLMGGYVTAFLTLGTFGFSLPVPVSILCGALLSFVVGIALGFPSLRVKDYYLVIITLAFSQLIPMILKSKYLVAYTGLGAGGGLPLPKPAPPAFLSFLGTPAWVYYFVAFFALLLCGFAYNLVHHSQMGRALRTIKCDVEVSMIIGIPVTRYKLLAFALSAFYAAFAGGLLFYLNCFISPDSYGARDTLNYMIAAVVGGPGTILGSFFGGAFLAFETDLTQAMARAFAHGEDLTRMFFGVILIITIYAAPRGIAGELTRRLKARYSVKPRRGGNYMFPPPDYDFLATNVTPIKDA